jgi:hypothetical protein
VTQVPPGLAGGDVWPPLSCLRPTQCSSLTAGLPSLELMFIIPSTPIPGDQQRSLLHTPFPEDAPEQAEQVDAVLEVSSTHLTAWSVVPCLPPAHQLQKAGTMSLSLRLHLFAGSLPGVWRHPTNPCGKHE